MLLLYTGSAFIPLRDASAAQCRSHYIDLPNCNLWFGSGPGHVCVCVYGGGMGCMHDALLTNSPVWYDRPNTPERKRMRSRCIAALLSFSFCRTRNRSIYHPARTRILQCVCVCASDECTQVYTEAKLNQEPARSQRSGSMQFQCKAIGR